MLQRMKLLVDITDNTGDTTMRARDALFSTVNLVAIYFAVLK